MFPATNSTTISLSSRYENLLRLEKYSDCIFRIESNLVKCHKLILSAASPVFEAMFFGSMREENTIDILDISPDVFYTLIYYIYTGVVEFDNLSIEYVIELYYGAEKYILSELIANSLNAIKQKLRFANILQALELSVCLELPGLLQICMSFFTRCCLTNNQFIEFTKKNYFHVSKNCIKSIIEANKNFKSLLWFVYQWCQKECDQLDLTKIECKLIIDDLDLETQLKCINSKETNQYHSNACKSIERSYFKACRPFVLDSENFEWNTTIKCDRFITLWGVIIHSRLMPSEQPFRRINQSADYHENLHLEIHSNSSRNPATDENNIVWQYKFNMLQTPYNCDLNILWNDDVILSPDVEYRIKLIWPSDAYGAEYPCSLQSNEVDGIMFKDTALSQQGSIIKGLRFLNLV